MSAVFKMGPYYASKSIIIKSLKHIIITKRKTKARWRGAIKNGNGTLIFHNYASLYSFASRFKDLMTRALKN